MEELTIPGIPGPLSWHNQPQHAEWLPGAELVVTAGPTTDWFVNPDGGTPNHNAPALLFPSTAPALLSARIAVDYAATYDAGVLVFYQSERSWAKACLELSPQGELTVVTVVTRGVSDDCNSFPVEGRGGYLRLARLQNACAVHFSTDGRAWRLVRHFKLDEPGDVSMGFLAQSPTGTGCRVTFGEISYELRLLSDIRSGE